MKASFIFFILYFIKFISCYNIYNITYSNEIEVFHTINRIKVYPYTKSILRLKLDNFKNVYAKLKIKKGAIVFNTAEAFGYTYYPSDDMLVNDQSRPLVKIKDGERSHDDNYDYYTYSFLTQKDLKYVSIFLTLDKTMNVTVYSE